MDQDLDPRIRVLYSLSNSKFERVKARVSVSLGLRESLLFDSNVVSVAVTDLKTGKTLTEQNEVKELLMEQHLVVRAGPALGYDLIWKPRDGRNSEST